MDEFFLKGDSFQIVSSVEPSISLYIFDIRGVAVCRKMIGDDDTLLIFLIESNDQNRYVINANKLSNRSYDKLEQFFLGQFDIEINTMSSVPIILYPPNFEGTFFKKTWLFKLKSFFRNPQEIAKELELSNDFISAIPPND